MATIQDQVDAIIAEATANAREYAAETVDFVNQAIQAASTLAVPEDPGNLDSADGINVEPPTIDYAAVFRDEMNSLKDEIISEVDGDWQAFLDQYFPLTLSTAQLDWLENAILNGGTGIAANVEDAIYNRGRDRLSEATNAVVDEVTAQFGSAGWAQPPGALASRIRRAKQEQLLKTCEINRDVMVNAAQLEQANVQFAVSQATELQKAVWDAAGIFINSLIRAYDPAVRAGAGISDATQQFYNQTLQYYRTFLFAEQFLHDHRAKDIEIDLSVADLGRQIIDNRAGRMTEAALGAAKHLGDMSASALGGQNSMAALEVRELA